MNENKISIIVYRENDVLFERLMESFESVIIPEDYEVELLEVSSGKNKAAAYNEGMNASDAKYKIYIDENVKILEPRIIIQILEKFLMNPEIGAIGMSGAIKVSDRCIAFESFVKCGKLMLQDGEVRAWDIGNGAEDTTVCLDGFFMATQCDTQWDERFSKKDSLFLYQAQSARIRREKKKLSVLSQNKPYIYVDLSYFSYVLEDKQQFIDEYKEEVWPCGDPNFSWRNFDDEANGKGHTFINRSKGSKELLIVVAGYKQFIWDDIFERVKLFTPEEMDVCLVLPGKDDDILKELSEKNGWSYLSTKQNKLSLAQNWAIGHHKKAEFIYKLDEDIYIAENYFENIRKTYENVKAERKYKIGIVVPLINVNGYSYRRLLEMEDKVADYEEKFGDAVYTCLGILAQNVGEAAQYLWELSFPLDEKAKQMQGNGYSICPHHFSIGAIAFTRELLQKIGGFAVAPEGVLGHEESQLCFYMTENSYVIVCAENTFVGHFGFGAQTEHMKKYYFENKEKFQLQK